MRGTAGLALLLPLAMLWGCTRTVLVPVPARVDLNSYGTLGVVEFESSAGPAVDARATREFQARVHAAQPGTRLVALGRRAAVLAAVGSRQLDADALSRIGAKYGVDAIFLGEISYSEKTNVKITDISRLEGGARSVIRGDISSKLVQTRGGASVWSSAAWATRQVGRVNVSAERGVSGAVQSSDPREEMVPTLLFHLTQDFRPSTVRQPAK
jgi:hypothetical protein